MRERILVAGAGQLGQSVALRLQACGHDVWALRRQPPAGPSPIRWLRGDLTEPQSLAGLPPAISQLVYMPAPGARTAAAYRAIFVDGLRHVLAALAPAVPARVLFVSSSAVYGEHHGDWIDETTVPAPLGFNGQILLEAEAWLAAQGLSSVSLRLAGLYGPDRLQLLQRLAAGHVQVPRQATHWANRMHSDDAAAAIVHLLALPTVAPLYVGVDDTPLPLAHLYDHLAGLIAAPPPADGPAPVAVGSKRLSNARLRASGFVPQWPDARQGYAALLGLRGAAITPT